MQLPHWTSWLVGSCALGNSTAWADCYLPLTYIALVIRTVGRCYTAQHELQLLLDAVASGYANFIARNVYGCLSHLWLRFRWCARSWNFASMAKFLCRAWYGLGKACANLEWWKAGVTRLVSGGCGFASDHPWHQLASNEDHANYCVSEPPGWWWRI